MMFKKCKDMQFSLDSSENNLLLCGSVTRKQYPYRHWNIIYNS